MVEESLVAAVVSVGSDKGPILVECPNGTAMRDSGYGLSEG